ncbi:MAG: GNAT family N-acetyltransferase [Paracoccaceae bacterium]
MFRLMQEKPEDGPEVEWLLDLAFAPGRGALSSYQLRQGVDPISQLCTVARDEYDVLAGAIRYWPVQIGDTHAPALLLGPIAVHPTRQGEGLGALLMGETLDIAADLGWIRVLLIGDAPYYRRFGFTPDVTRALDFPKPYNPQRLLGLALTEGAFENCPGMVQSAGGARV